MLYSLFLVLITEAYNLFADIVYLPTSIFWGAVEAVMLSLWSCVYTHAVSTHIPFNDITAKFAHFSFQVILSQNDKIKKAESSASFLVVSSLVSANYIIEKCTSLNILWLRCLVNHYCLKWP